MTNVSMEDIRKLVGLQPGVRLIAEHARLVEDLGAESADVANLVAAVEEKHHITVKDSEIAKSSPLLRVSMCSVAKKSLRDFYLPKQ